MNYKIIDAIVEDMERYFRIADQWQKHADRTSENPLSRYPDACLQSAIHYTELGRELANFMTDYLGVTWEEPNYDLLAT